ncbi:MAG: hypothetical protein Aurels2KO_44980 [Aureliella sp.]
MGILSFLKQLVAPANRNVEPDRTHEVRPQSLDSSQTASQSHPAATTVESNELTDGLDASNFQPLSQSEALSLTKGTDWKSAYFDSLNTIPPKDLPRIRVIDRTMVGMGLISDEELAEIHRVGAEMSQYRTDASAVYAAGQSAVQAARQERQRLREAKRAAAAQKRQEYARQVAERRATDITYLGRGVSRGLCDRRSNVEQLRQLELPVLSTPADVAQVMGISVPRLRWLAFFSEAAERTHYVRFEIPKKSGGTRTIARPHRSLAAAQRWILDEVLSRLPVHDAAHGFVPGRSIITGAKQHAGQDIILNVDLKDFFPTISAKRVDGFFRRLGYSPAVSTIFALLCTEASRDTIRYAGAEYQVARGLPTLPQGACTSPALSNQVARHLDVRLAGLSKSLGWTYTRYADDLSFSARQSEEHEKEKQVGYLLASLNHICRSEGFEINDAKTRVLRKHTRQVVTGLTVNDSVKVPRKLRRRIRAILHRAQFEGLAAQNRDDHPNFHSWLSGMIAFIESVDPVEGNRLRTALGALNQS